jgi:hypothetical protein
MFADEKHGDDLDLSQEEIEDLDAPEKEGEDVKGGMKPVISTRGCTCSKDCLSI